MANVVQGRLVSLADARFHQHGAYAPFLQLAQGVDSLLTTPDAPRWLLSHLNLGDQIAGGGVPTRKVDPRLLSDEAAASVAPDEVLRPQRCAVGQRHVDASIVLRKPRDLTTAIENHWQLGHPLGHDSLDLLLRECKAVVVASREVADIERYEREACHLHRLSLREEPIGDPPLIEGLNGARVQAACAVAAELLVQPPLNGRDVDTSQCQFTGQHQPCRASSNDNHCMLGEGYAPHRSLHHFQVGRTFYADFLALCSRLVHSLLF
jgi:hypothetical protein